jgi:hypothetical protein
MNIVQILFFGLFALLPSPDRKVQQAECDDIQAIAKISQEPNGSKIMISIEGGYAPFKYLFYKKSGHLLSENFDSSTTTVIDKGKYFCTVIDKRNCKKTIEFEVK